MVTHDRRLIVLACACVIAVAAARASSQSGMLTVERQGDRLRLSAPQFHFLEGRPLDRLHDGAAVTYLFTVTVEADHGGTRVPRLEERFVLSYDLWEEKFSVVQAGPPHRSTSHLSAPMAEAWCLDNLLVRVGSLPSEKPFVVKLRCSVPEEEPPQSGEGLTLSALIDVFSRKRSVEPPHWEVLSAPLRLGDLRDRTKH